MKTYAISDVHGLWPKFSDFLDTLEPDDIVYVLGDVIDRGPEGIQILQYIIDHPDQFKMVIGNHEDMMLRYIEATKGVDLEKASYFQIKEIRRLYDECYHTEEIFMDVLKLLYPDDTFKTGTIRGYSQGDWQEYIVKEDVDIDLLENFYFGKVSDIFVEMEDGENFSAVITDDELWELEENGNLKQYLRELCDLSDDEPIKILQADGYIQVLNWKEVC